MKAYFQEFLTDIDIESYYREIQGHSYTDCELKMLSEKYLYFTYRDVSIYEVLSLFISVCITM